jgi:branched-chain amino acid transport system substrate-binding protein
VALSGDFRETQFADLIQFYEISRQSVAVTIRLGAPAGDPDGVFYFERGSLVSGRLRGREGRDALREALRLRKGTFTVAIGVTPPGGARPEAWRSVVQEELGRVEQEVQPRTSPSVNAPPTAPAPSEPRPAAAPPERSPAARPPGAPSDAPQRGRHVIVPTPRRRSVTGIVALGFVGLAALAIAAVVFLLLSKPAQRADVAIEQILSPPPVRGVSPTEITFGMASPFSGANRELGRGMKAGIEAAFGEVNAAGGLHGRRLRLVAMDDGYEPSRTGPVMKQLVERERIFAVVGNVGTPTAAVSVPYCLAQKVPFIGALSGSEILRKSPPDRYVFNFRPSYPEETAAAVRWLVDVRRIPPARIAVFAQEDAFGESGWLGATGELKKRGVDPARILRVGYRRNTADVTDAVAKVKERAAALDAVVMVATYKPAAAFIRKLRDAGLGLVTTNVSPVDANALAEELVGSGPRYTAGVVVTQVVPLPTSRAPAAVRFQEAMARYGAGEPPGFLTLEGWILGHVLAEGLRRAGSDLDPERLVAALEEIRGLDLGIGTPISFGPQEHQGSHKVWGTMLQPDGSWKQIDLP